MVDAMLLEWEGVLADTGAARRNAMLRALADDGVLVSAAGYGACCEGLDTLGAASAALASVGVHDDTRAELVALRASRSFREWLAQGFSLQALAGEMIEAFAHRTRLAIVTRASRAETEIVLSLAGIESAVACVVSADDVLMVPPAPELYQRALAQLSRRRSVAPQRSVALVHAAASVRAARGAGVRTLVVGASAHVAMEADAAVPDLAGLTSDSVAALLGITAVTVSE